MVGVGIDGAFLPTAKAGASRASLVKILLYN